MKRVVLSTTEAEYMAHSRGGERTEIHCAVIADHEHCSGTTNYCACGQCWCNMAFKQQKYRRQNKAHRHKNFFCERISGRWKDHHQICEVRR